MDNHDGIFAVGEIRQTLNTSGLIVEFNLDADSDADMTILIPELKTLLGPTDFLL